MHPFHKTYIPAIAKLIITGRKF